MPSFRIPRPLAPLSALCPPLSLCGGMVVCIPKERVAGGGWQEVVVKTVTAAMMAHADSAGVLEQGCRALCNLAYHSANTEAIATHGGACPPLSL
jgi:hypothetical protein